MKLSHNNKLRRFAIALSIIVICLGCDRATKHIANRTLTGESVHTYWGGTIRVQRAENEGGFLGIWASRSEQTRFWLLIVMNSAFLVTITGILIVKWDMQLSRFVSAALIVGGGIGNLIDRIWNHGRVIDFMNLGIGNLRTGIFNVADVAITVGVIVLMAISWRDEKELKCAEMQRT